MQFDFFARFKQPQSPPAGTLQIGELSVPVRYVRNLRARRYVLRVTRDGWARVTIPRGGTITFAFEFARKHSAWIVKQLHKRSAEPARPATWTEGAQILFRGDLVTIHAEQRGESMMVTFGSETMTTAAGTVDLRPEIESHLWSLADKELAARTRQLAAAHQLDVNRVVVRSQRTRWGSCSPQRTISLNWRLVQAPIFVRDYLIIHELMHLCEMNHSRRFWRLVEAACPDYERAEAWLNAHAWLLR